MKFAEPESTGSNRRSHILGTWTRIYIHGFIGLVAIFIVAYIIKQLAPLFDFVGNPVLSAIVAILVVIIAPPLLGSLILFGVFPLMGRKEAWKGIDVWDERLVNEVADAKERSKIVIVNWPSDEVRSIGVLTSTFKSEASGIEMATVYIPTVPPTKFGYVHVMPLSSIERTTWTLKEWQLYQLTFGAMAPDRIS